MHTPIHCIRPEIQRIETASSVNEHHLAICYRDAGALIAVNKFFIILAHKLLINAI